MSEPSKVIHVRNVGQEISENDLLQLFQPFGVITKLVMLRAKNQALVQMQEIPQAVSVLQFYSNVQPSIRGRNVYVQFSSHQELTTMDQNTHARGEEPNRILLATIHHMQYRIDVDVLHQVFSPHGMVEKIVTFQKLAGFQALIQYNSQHSAITARNLLQGRNIYDGCCQLDIQFSTLDELQVNYNNDRTRDFTNPSLPAEAKGRSSQSGYADAGNMYALQAGGASADAFSQMAHHTAITTAFGGVLPPGISGMNERCTILASNLDSDRIDEDKLFNLFSLFGNIVRIKLLRNKPDHALVQMSDGFQAELAVHFLKGAVLFGKQLDVNYSKYPSITAGAETHEYSNSNLNRFNRNAAKNYRYCCSPTKMIHLSTLPQDVTEEDIVNHLEEHGTIMGTKLFETNAKKQALVLFENEEQATEALVCKHMGNYMTWGCLKYIPHRLAGVALVAPVINYWWPSFPVELSKEAHKQLLKRDQWMMWIARNTPWLLYWWMTQKLFPSSTAMEKNPIIFSDRDLRTIKKISKVPNPHEHKARQQGDAESLHRDLKVWMRRWEFDPMELSKSSTEEGSVHLWHGREDRMVPYKLQRYIAKKLPWIKYHEVPDGGHLLILDDVLRESIFKSLILGEEPSFE